MRRENLIGQVKEIYAGLAAAENQNHFHQTTTGITPDAYYETLLSAVLSEISRGTFDNCRSGTEIVNKVAADKSVLTEWRE